MAGHCGKFKSSQGLALAATALPLVMIFLLHAPACGQTSQPQLNPNEATTRPDPDSPLEFSALPAGPTFSLCITHDLQNNIWVGTEGNGIWVLRSGQWQQFLTKDGLGDDSCYAIACDRSGRIWCGQRSHGVSVYCNGQWKNYTIENGPSGSHINAIAVCPTDGDVWMAGENGLSRYGQSARQWQYFNRALGLPSDMISSIAFDSAGNLVLGTACDGIILADAADGYQKYRQITGPENIPRQSAGAGIAGNCINQVVVAHDGTIYAATTRGLATSHDHGKSWSYFRGQDWEALARQSYEGVPADWRPDAPGTVKEDWVTSVAEDATGRLWLGFRSAAMQLIDPKTSENIKLITANRLWNSAFAPLADGSVLAATYTAQVFQFAPKAVGRPLAPAIPAVGASPVAAPDFPAPARAPTPREYSALLKRVQDLPQGKVPSAAVLGQDWETMGDWCGRYGRQYSEIVSAGFAGDFGKYQIDQSAGPFFPGRGIYNYTYDMTGLDQATAPFDPTAGVRRMREHNDGSFHIQEFPLTMQGPDLYVSVTVPSGVYRVALYIVNPNGHESNNIYRDYLIEVKPPRPPLAIVDPAGRQNAIQESLIPVELSPSLARARVNRIRAGVYQQFLINGAGTWWFKISRNHSFVTIVQGVFLDRIDGNILQAPLKFQNKIVFDPPPVPTAASLVEARALWDGMDQSQAREGAGSVDRFIRLMAYRIAVEAEGDVNLLANWRWHLQIWNPADRDAFYQFAMQCAKEAGATTMPSQ